MSQFSKDIDSLSVKGAEKLDSATFDRISGYIQSGKIRAEDVDSLSKGVQHVDSAAFDRISKAIERENVQSPVQEKPKTAGDQLLEFSNKVATAVSPRFMKMSNIDNVSDFGRGLLSTGLDIASLGPRAAVSTLATPLDLITDTYEKGFGSAILNQPSRFIENLGVTETPKGTGIAGVVEDVARSPYLPVPGVGSFVPKTASFVPKLAAGLGDIALGAGMGTAESVARNEGVSPLGVGIGGALGALNPLGRAFKSGADYISDRAFTGKFVKEMQDLYLKGNDAEREYAKKFLDMYTATPTPETVRNEIGNQLIYVGDRQKENLATEAGNIARSNAINAGKTESEIFIIGKNAEDAAREAAVFPNVPELPRFPVDRTLAQGTRDVTRWKAPNVPGVASDNRFLRGAEKASDITGSPSTGAVLSLLTGVGSPYFLYDALKKNPHLLADKTRVVPKQTGTAIRNLGTGLFGREEQ